jgi:hypothetical protein
MDKIVIKSAIMSAISLLNSELETVTYEELEVEYKNVLEELEKALIEIDSE